MDEEQNDLWLEEESEENAEEIPWAESILDFADWNQDEDTPVCDEELEEALAEERNAALESELEQDEHPRDYAAELEDEDEEDEAAPKSDKRLKLEILAEALKRTEESARTLKDFQGVIAEWDRLDRNRERRERDHENLRGDVPLEFQAVPEPRIVPVWMNDPEYRQLCSGFFLDILFDCPYEMHELTANEFISDMVRDLSEEHKEVLYFLSLRLYSATKLAALRGQSDRNIRKLRLTIHKKLQRAFYQHLQEKQEAGGSLTLREQEFFRVFGELLQTMGKNAVIRPENKTKPRKKKAALDEAKGG